MFSCTKKTNGENVPPSFRIFFGKDKSFHIKSLPASDIESDKMETFLDEVSQCAHEQYLPKREKKDADKYRIVRMRSTYLLKKGKIDAYKCHIVRMRSISQKERKKTQISVTLCACAVSPKKREQ